TVDQLGADLPFEAALVRIARTMLSLRHGGTLLILPEGTNWEEAAPGKRYVPTTPVTVVKDAESCNRQYRERRNKIVRQLCDGVVNPETVSVLADDLVRSRYASELEWLARLTATDGMTVVLPDFTILGFGVFFDTKEDNLTRVVVIDPYDDGTDREPKALASI